MAQTKVRFDRAVEGATNIVDSGTEGTKLPLTSKMQSKSSDIVGNITFSPNNNFDLNYNYSADNNLDTTRISLEFRLYHYAPLS